MAIKLKYFLGVLLAMPVMPVLWWQGQRILQSIPKVPQPTDVSGHTGRGKPPFQVLAIGESSIAAVGARSSHQGLVGHIAKYLAEHTRRQVVWAIYAESGLTMKHITEGLVPQLGGYASEPDLILVGVGVNDVFKINHPTGFKRDLEALISSIRKIFPRKPMVFIHMPPLRSFPVWTGLLRFFMGGLGDLFDRQMKKIIEDHTEVYYCDDPITIPKFRQKLGYPVEDEIFFSDGVHPSELTYRLWGEEVGEFVLRSVC